MRISILGRGALAEPLAFLARRAGHTVRRLETAEPMHAGDMGQLAVLAGTREAVEPILARRVPAETADIIIVDATTPTHDDRGRRDDHGDSAWIVDALPGSRVVRAFASVPVEALSAAGNAPREQQAERLTVPLAGDDARAKATVEELMRDIGVEPFDLGGLGNAGVIEPGGALWGRALSQIEMLEAVGWLSGDG